MSTPQPAQTAARKVELQQLASEEDQIARRMAAVHGQVYRPEPWVSLADVRKSVPAGAVLIELARFDVRNFASLDRRSQWQPARYAAWIVPPSDGGDVRIIDLGEAQPIDEAVQAAGLALTAAIGTPQRKGVISELGEPEAEHQLAAPLQTLAKLVLAPLLAEVGDARQLIVSPDAALWLAPWNALQLADGRYAIEDFTFRFVVCGRDLVVPRVAAGKVGPPVVMADPDFDLRLTSTPTSPPESPPTTAASGRLDANSASYALDATRSAASLRLVARLPSTAAEAQAIVPKMQAFTGQAPGLYTRELAQESTFKSLARPQVAVLCTHGFFLPDQKVRRDDRPAAASQQQPPNVEVAEGLLENPLLRCGLLLAGCNHRDPAADANAEDGVLTGMEIVGTDLRGTELVVLSACETGLGQVQNGEGVAGLRQAFQLAGAQSVVATLWQIPDKESAKLMSDFFANLAAGQGKAGALRNAQLVMIKHRRDRHGAAHPFFWAAFTLTGSGN